MNPRIFFFHSQNIRSPYYNLAVEEAISLQLNQFGITAGIRVWRNPSTLVLGLSENPNQTIKEDVIQRFLDWRSKISNLPKHMIPNLTYIARRASGGGTVFQNQKGNINYSIYVNLNQRPELYAVKESYQILLSLVTTALAKQNIFASMEGKSDIVLQTESKLKKISGNAQFRKKNCIVQHGTLILKEELIEDVMDLMPHPPEEPEYRKRRSHKDFLTALPERFDEEAFGKELFFALHTYLEGAESKWKDEFSFFHPGFSSFRKQVLRESEIIRKKKYESLTYLLNREIST
ncbi:biotin/lipoate A/B protein ligase family protein [Leptospira ryugenii]|uniref:Biotin/lipoate A/B protein ligase family protein n=1 Tax=Leptospira ryugenii TaxID=1917863 RepID=A0A2P2DYX9_9LEPT|nr:lipoate--protein ligase [Leptospira ryugenii]GBF49823.1 biotin/lipoate A/B protein ligase family protein [Leptospira ryugenii]